MKTLTLSCLLVLGACASEEHRQPPAASVHSEVSAGGDSASPAVHDRSPAREHIAEPESYHTHLTSDDHAEPRDSTANGVADPHPVNNTGVNQRDVQPVAVTATDQKENAADLKITQRIRQAVMADDSLSATAKNSKIITQDGRVTLRGPVKTAAERTAIAAHADRFASGHVDNQLEVEQ
jgi:hyperosmotically inducible periplasmic protein